MDSLILLKSCDSLHSLATTLGYEPKKFAYIIYGIKQQVKYTDFEIPKRTGGKRIISAPRPELKLLQARLSTLLHNCISDINKNKDIKKTFSHGFRRKHSILTNAKIHKNKRYVFNIDLEDFFGTIHFGRVRGYFIKNRNFELCPEIATIIAQIACHNNSLPQGSPCSPVITNLICHFLDIRLAKLAKNNRCKYSRYADDITFSTNKNSFPVGIAFLNKENNKWDVGENLRSEIYKADFKINSLKTRMQYYWSRQDVTGLVVNKKINSTKEYWKNVRAMCHSVFETGEYFYPKLTLDDNGKVKKENEKGTLEKLHGRLSFIYQSDNFNYINDMDSNNKQKNKYILNSRERVFKKFLFYKYFFRNEKPIIICEGKTDNIYIKCALKSLRNLYPSLIEGENKLVFFNYTNTNKRILELSGGVGDLKKFVSQYDKAIRQFKDMSHKKKVIIIADNDDAGRDIERTIYKKYKISSSGSEFINVYENLYFFLIPKLNNKNTVIEQYFDKKWMDLKLSGKSFNYNIPFDETNEYGKHIFSHEVIRKNQNNIEFTNFKKILDIINKIINA